MRLNRHAVGAVAASAAVFVGGGAALASSGVADRGASCDERLAKIAAARGVTVAQLEADLKARLIARIDAAEETGRLSKERAAKLRERVSASSLCGTGKRVKAGLAPLGMLKAAGVFLGLDRAELVKQLPGTSLVALAEKQGKTEAALERAMVAPAKARLAKAVTDGKLTQPRADAALERLERAADRLANKTFPKR